MMKWISGVLFKNPVPMFHMFGPCYKSLGYVQIAVSSSAVGVGVVPADAVMALMTVEGGDVRFRDDGVDPASAIGMRVEKNGILKYDADPAALKFIAVSSAAKVNLTFYGVGGTDA